MIETGTISSSLTKWFAVICDPASSEEERARTRAMHEAAVNGVFRQQQQAEQQALEALVDRRVDARLREHGFINEEAGSIHAART